ncbi:MAG: metal-dependent transcriptional regulator [Methanomicrobiales archaeon]|nr:metal-dependent transcriptional regulator [Methanomicrobiales archaeon]
MTNHIWPRWPLSIEQRRDNDLTQDTIQQCITNLTKAELLDESNNCLALTEKGIDAGRKIHQKHKVLSCFFTEMLGMKPDDASSQACILEHTASDDTIKRLDTYLSKNLGRTYLSSKTSDKKDSHHDTPPFFLSQGKKGEQYEIIAIKGCNRLQRLTDLGLIPGAHLRITQQLARSLVVTVKDCDIAISPEIASVILVTPWKNNA